MNHFTAPHQTHNLWQVLQLAAVAHEARNIYSSLGQHMHNALNVYIRPTLPSLGADQCAPKVQRQRMDTHTLILWHNTKQHATSAAKFGQIVGSFDDFRVSGAINCDVGQAAENFLHALGGIFARGVDRVRQTVFGCFGQFVIMKIDADDRLRSSQLGSEHRTQPDAPYPKDDHRLARFDFGVVVDDTEAGGERVSEQATQLEIRVGRNFGQTVFGNNRILLECGDRTGIHLASVPLVNRPAGVDPRPRTPMTDHTIPGRDVCHVRANFKHDSSRFMPKQMRKELVRAFDPIDLPDLRSANPRGVDFDKHLTALERRHLDFIDDQRFALLDQDGGWCFQRILTTDTTDITDWFCPDKPEVIGRIGHRWHSGGLATQPEGKFHERDLTRLKRRILTTDGTDCTNRFRTNPFSGHQCH